MFLFLPILIVIVLIQVAVKSIGQIGPSESKQTLAFCIVFGIAPLLIAIVTYGSHYLNRIKPRYTDKTLWFSATIPYIVFFYLISTQLYDSKNEKWLLVVFNGSNNSFEWLRQYLIQKYLAQPETIQTLGAIITSFINILYVLQYYIVFGFYLFVYYFFNQKGSRDYNTPQLVAFIGANRIVLLGFWLVIIFEFLMAAINWQNDFFAFKKNNANGDFYLLFYCILEGFSEFIVPLIILLIFPLILPLAAGWKKLENSEYLSLLAKTANENNFKYNNIYLANNPGLITAGIIGVFSRTTNLFFTKDILSILNEKEIEAVMLHEIGHSKYKHIIFYLFFFMLIKTFLMFLVFIPGIEIFGGVISFVILLISLRYAWGWLSRQFERQADLNAAEAQGTPEHIVNSFYKIAGRGHALDKPSWHHGSLRERINNLIEAFETNGSTIRIAYHNHIKKIKTMILLSFLIVSGIWIFINYNNEPKGDLKAALVNSKLAFASLLEKKYALSEKYYLEANSILENKNSRFEKDKKRNQLLAINYYNLSCCYALWGKHKEALVFLDKTLPLFDFELMTHRSISPLNVLKVQTDPDLNSIRNLPEFSLFVEELKKIEKSFSIQSWQENR